MLTKEQNDLLTQTGPGTPGGDFLRSYWQPVATIEEIPLGGNPLPIRIMSEDLVLFRDDQDRLGLVQRRCPHRGVDLSYGRIEDGGIRCLYHGWLFDIHGKCIDQPAERRKFCDSVPMKAYPVQEKGGVVWTYMGKGEPPEIPDFQFLLGSEPHRQAFRVIQMCNWLQGLESSIDPVHTTYLHRRPAGTPSQRSGADVVALRGTEPPEVSTEPTKSGIRIYALHNAPNDRKYLRINNYVYPTGSAASTSGGENAYQGRWYVPIDDYSHCRFEFFYSHVEPLNKERLRKNRNENVGPDLRHVRRAENRYLQDRELMKTGHFTGMGMHFPSHDAFATESQGPIQDRTQEYLGATDAVIVAVRKILLKAIDQVRDGKSAPGLVRKAGDNPFADFVCMSSYIEDHEDGPGFCRRVLASKAAAE